MLVASGYRVQTLWYDAGPHRVEASAAAGRSVTVTDHYTDAYGDTGRTFTVRLASVTPRQRVPGFGGPDDPPAGLEAVAVHLHWSAPPDQSLVYCTVVAVDDRGRRYEPPPDSFQSDPCVPQDHEGPATADSKEHPRGYVEPGAERPPTWATRVVFIVPPGTHITRALLWWTTPHYIELAAP
jgi:hypothetical protein